VLNKQRPNRFRIHAKMRKRFPRSGNARTCVFNVDVAAVAVDDVNVILCQAAMNNKIVTSKSLLRGEPRSKKKV
jgi:hypothetical protein